MASFYRISVFTEKYFRTDHSLLNLAILDIRHKLQYQQCHWYAQNQSDDLFSPIEVSDVSVPFSDDVFQNLTVNVNLL